MESNLKLETIMKEGMIPKEHAGGENWEILHGDTLKLVKAFETAVFDAVVTDPPSRISCSNFLRSLSSLCWQDTTTEWIRTGFPSSYSTVTCALPSGRIPAIYPLFRDAVSSRTIRPASTTGIGMNCGVSLQAKPTITPWSPAPSFCPSCSPDTPALCSFEWSTASAISGLCWCKNTSI